jgi:hypothetical protein
VPRLVAGVMDVKGYDLGPRSLDRLLPDHEVRSAYGSAGSALILRRHHHRSRHHAEHFTFDFPSPQHNQRSDRDCPFVTHIAPLAGSTMEVIGRCRPESDDWSYRRPSEGLRRRVDQSAGALVGSFQISSAATPVACMPPMSTSASATSMKRRAPGTGGELKMARR